MSAENILTNTPSEPSEEEKQAELKYNKEMVILQKDCTKFFQKLLEKGLMTQVIVQANTILGREINNYIFKTKHYKNINDFNKRNELAFHTEFKEAKEKFDISPLKDVELI